MGLLLWHLLQTHVFNLTNGCAFAGFALNEPPLNEWPFNEWALNEWPFNEGSSMSGH